MRISRALGSDGEVSHYHCISRCVGGAFLLGDVEKERLRNLIWSVSRFCGAEVITYCVMSNHFHLLVRFQPVPELAELGESEIIERVAALNGRAAAKGLEFVVKNLRDQGHEAAALEQLELARERMGKVSVLMQEIKQRFTRWYNKGHSRYGTLWADRFKSVLVENNPVALQVMAAYIDLNPVRAELVSEPESYRWCGYAEAMGGRVLARRGLALALCEEEERTSDWRRTQRAYRAWLYESGEQQGEGRDPVTGERARAGIDPGKVKEVLEANGQPSLAEVLRLRVRYLTDGYVIGSQGWVNAFWEEHREDFGERRKSGGRKLRGAAWQGLCSLRDLRVEVFG